MEGWPVKMKNIYTTTWDGKTLKIPEEGIYKIKIKKISF
ncbi:MAG: hypothetical protein CM15mP32_4410 [Flavobacteriaceae bacterium]|nr:MAG: hypothetical protein CM15mP32_4410 [Flavobacteriaceae bacterium]